MIINISLGKVASATSNKAVPMDKVSLENKKDSKVKVKVHILPEDIERNIG